MQPVNPHRHSSDMNFHAKSGWKSSLQHIPEGSYLCCHLDKRQPGQKNLSQTCCRPAVSAHNRTTRLALIFSSFHILFPIFLLFLHPEVAWTVLSFISVVFFPLSFPSSLTEIPKRLQGCLHYWLWHVWKEGKMISNGVVIVPQGSKPASQCPVL